MSETVRSFGFIAILATPITNELEREELGELLWSKSGLLGINHEGTLAILDLNKNSRDRGDIHHFNVGNEPHGETSVMLHHCSHHDLKILERTVQPFSSIWYNGSDAPQNEMTLEEFKKLLVK